MIEEVYRSPRRVALLEGFLADRREPSRDIAGWCERPRICDLAAEWLAGYAGDAPDFPGGATEVGRDVAVAAILQALRERPATFEVLTREG